MWSISQSQGISDAVTHQTEKEASEERLDREPDAELGIPAICESLVSLFKSVSG